MLFYFWEVMKMSFEFAEIIGDKQEFYKALNAQLAHLLAGESDLTANLANASALLWMQMDQINWAGFYIWRKDQLVLGPFQGKPACVRIAYGKGVCGAAVAEKATQLVPDVHLFPGHIACDAASRSEIVVPIIVNGQVKGVLDIDSPLPARFDETDQNGLEQFVQTLIRHCDWNALSDMDR